MNDNIDPDTALAKDAPQHAAFKDNAKDSLPLRRPASASTVETPSNNIPSRDASTVSDDTSSTADESLDNEDITNMDSFFDVGDSTENTSHDDAIPADASVDTELTQSDSDITDELVLGKVPVKITVELGSFIVDAANSSNLAAGDVLTLNTICPGQVRLMCDDAEVGRGELVDINGQLGVQIVHNWSR